MASVPKRSITIAAWNSRGLRNKKEELIEFIRDKNVDILTVSETFLNSDTKFNIHNFKSYRTDRTTFGGGVAIFVRNSLIHCKIPTPHTPSIETVAIQIKVNNAIYSIISAYRPPNLRYSCKDINKLFGTGKNVIIAGDLNCKNKLWHCASNNVAGSKLKDHALKKSFRILFPNSPTFYSSSGRSSILDIVLVKNAPQISDISVINDLSSDHLPIMFSINGHPAHTSTDSYNFSRANWIAYKAYINKNIDISNTLESSSDIDNAIDSVNKVITEAARSHIPIIKHKSSLPSIPLDIKNKIVIKNRLRKIWCKTGITIFKKQVNSLTDEIRKDLKEYSNSIWNSKIRDLSTSNNSLWKLSKSLKSRASHFPSFLTSGASRLYNDKEKSEILADHFSNAHNLTSINSTNKIESTVAKSVLAVRNALPVRIDFLSLTELKNIIQGLKNKKSPGIDLISNVLIKHAPSKLVILLNNIINCAMKISYFPNVWKLATVVPIPKAGKNPASPESYRPISLLSSVGKIFEKVLLVRLLKAHKNTIPDCQFGFKPEHNTVLQLSRLAHDIRCNFNDKKSTGMLLLDMEKAFDTVWHDGLIHKLRITNTPVYLTKILDSYLSGRSFSVKVNQERSSVRPVHAGVPQGGVLSASLFNIYISDIPTPRNCQLALYADDTSCYTSSHRLDTIHRRLQLALLQLNTYFRRWKLKVNETKTESIVFTNRRKTQPSKKLHLNGIDIPWSNRVKYLGVLLNSRLNFSCHIDYVISKALKGLFSLYPIINRKSVLSTKNKWLIYTTILRPVLTYSSHTWATIAKSHIKKLQTFQNKYVKMCFNLPPRTNLKKFHSANNLQTIEQLLSRFNMKVTSKASRINNSLIRKLNSRTFKRIKYNYTFADLRHEKRGDPLEKSLV